MPMQNSRNANTRVCVLHCVCVRIMRMCLWLYKALLKRGMPVQESSNANTSMCMRITLCVYVRVRACHIVKSAPANRAVLMLKTSAACRKKRTQPGKKLCVAGRKHVFEELRSNVATRYVHCLANRFDMKEQGCGCVLLSKHTT
eukprot:324424-Pelagomonas_calceolata.AAC.2